MPAAITLVAAAASEAGLVRQNNEDAAYAGRWLYAVADGLGGHAAGEVASAAAIETLRGYDAETDPAELLETLGRAAIAANREIGRRASEDPARLGMGTTLTALLCSGTSAALLHVGDSRAFRLRDGHLRRITEDHILGQLMSDADALAPVLSRYLDGNPGRSPDLGLRELQAGDRYLLCSDGLSPFVGTDALRDVLLTSADPHGAVRRLVALAEAAGGEDNITVIVVDVQLAGAEIPATAPMLLGAADSALAR
jgi:serine/threonine protein phosphatase PrpC